MVTQKGRPEGVIPVGARVTLRLMGHVVSGRVLEDRGPLAVGQQLLRIELTGAGRAGMILELPAAEVRLKRARGSGR